jgi:hypothetical protein
MESALHAVGDSKKTERRSSKSHIVGVRRRSHSKSKSGSRSHRQPNQRNHSSSSSKRHARAGRNHHGCSDDDDSGDSDDDGDTMSPFPGIKLRSAASDDAPASEAAPFPGVRLLGEAGLRSAGGQISGSFSADDLLALAKQPVHVAGVATSPKQQEAAADTDDKDRLPRGKPAPTRMLSLSAVNHDNSNASRSSGGGGNDNDAQPRANRGAQTARAPTRTATPPSPSSSSSSSASPPSSPTSVPSRLPMWATIRVMSEALSRAVHGDNAHAELVSNVRALATGLRDLIEASPCGGDDTSLHSMRAALQRLATAIKSGAARAEQRAALGEVARSLWRRCIDMEAELVAAQPKSVPTMVHAFVADLRSLMSSSSAAAALGLAATQLSLMRASIARIAVERDVLSQMTLHNAAEGVALSLHAVFGALPGALESQHTMPMAASLRKISPLLSSPSVVAESSAQSLVDALPPSALAGVLEKARDALMANMGRCARSPRDVQQCSALVDLASMQALTLTSLSSSVRAAGGASPLSAPAAELVRALGQLPDAFDAVLDGPEMPSATVLLGERLSKRLRELVDALVGQFGALSSLAAIDSASALSESSVLNLPLLACSAASLHIASIQIAIVIQV